MVNVLLVILVRFILFGLPILIILAIRLRPHPHPLGPRQQFTLANGSRHNRLYPSYVTAVILSLFKCEVLTERQESLERLSIVQLCTRSSKR